MSERFIRTGLLFGEAAVKKLAKCRVAVFGIGGVGGYTVEALVRSGLGEIDLIDNDTVCMSNLNRQIIATESTVGQYKTQAAHRRILDINPDVKVTEHRVFLTPDNIGEFDLAAYDYVVDAIDTVSSKIALAVRCCEVGTPIISSMGAGNKVDPTAFEVADIYKTSVDPLARVMRRELKRRGVKALKVVFSKEQPIIPQEKVHIQDTASDNVDETNIDTEVNTSERPGRIPPGSNAFVPPVVGLIIAGEVIKDLIGFGK